MAVYLPPLLPNGRKRNRLVKQALPLILPSDEFFDGLCADLCHQTGADAACMMVVDHQRSYIRAKAGIGGLPNPEGVVPHTSTFCVNVIADGQPLVVADTRRFPKLAGCLTTETWGGWIGCPFEYEGIRIGAVNAMTHDPHVWAPEDLDRVRRAAERIGGELGGRNG